MNFCLLQHRFCNRFPANRLRCLSGSGSEKLGGSFGGATSRIAGILLPLGALLLVSVTPALARSSQDQSSAQNSSQKKRVIKVPIKIKYARVLHTVQPKYPPAAKAKGIQGTVVLSGIVGTNGRARDLKYVSGPRPLAQAAIDAVRQWRFKPSTFDGKPHAVPWTFHLNFGLPSARPPAKQTRIGSRAMTEKLVHQVPPLYPAEAAQKGIQGNVVLRVLVGKNGHVKSLSRISGNPMLAKAAIAAVRQWVYQPTLIHGKPVKVHLTVTVHFTLPKGG